MTRRQKRISGLFLAPLLVLLIAVPWTLHGMAEKDLEHAKFYNTGKTINAFLKSY